MKLLSQITLGKKKKEVLIELSNGQFLGKKVEKKFMDKLDFGRRASCLECLEIPDLESCHHISLLKSGDMWLSDYFGNLVLMDSSGRRLKHVNCSGGYGFHDVTKTGELMMADFKLNCVVEIHSMGSTTKVLFSTGQWSPCCIHYSRISGDILLGMKTSSKGCVARFNSQGKELQRITSRPNGERLYSEPIYITENKNGDICTSDWYKEALVVVSRSGRHKFSFHGGKGEHFFPGSVCTNKKGHILLYETFSRSIHIFSTDGILLDVIIHERFSTGLQFVPQGMCVDEGQHLWLGNNCDMNLVSVYKYIYSYKKPTKCSILKCF